MKKKPYCILLFCCCVCMLLSVFLNGCSTSEESDRSVWSSTGPTEGGLSSKEVPEESLQPSEQIPGGSNVPVPEESRTPNGTLPFEPTAQMFHFEGLDAALFEGAYAAYYADEWVTPFVDFPRIVIPHVNVLGTYEDDGVLYYVCDVMYKLHYYNENDGTFDAAVGSLATPCRIGLVDMGNGSFEVKSGLLPPNGAQYGRVMKELFGPLDNLYQKYISEDGVQEVIRSFPSSDEMWAVYISATEVQ